MVRCWPYYATILFQAWDFFGFFAVSGIFETAGVIPEIDASPIGDILMQY
jgi:hypothetical protein